MLEKPHRTVTTSSFTPRLGKAIARVSWSNLLSAVTMFDVLPDDVEDVSLAATTVWLS